MVLQVIVPVWHGFSASFCLKTSQPYAKRVEPILAVLLQNLLEVVFFWQWKYQLLAAFLRSLPNAAPLSLPHRPPLVELPAAPEVPTPGQDSSTCHATLSPPPASPSSAGRDPLHKLTSIAVAEGAKQQR